MIIQGIDEANKLTIKLTNELMVKFNDDVKWISAKEMFRKTIREVEVFIREIIQKRTFAREELELIKVMTEWEWSEQIFKKKYLDSIKSKVAKLLAKGGDGGKV